MDYLSASSNTRVTDYEIWSDFSWLKLLAIFGVQHFHLLYAFLPHHIQESCTLKNGPVLFAHPVYTSLFTK